VDFETEKRNNTTGKQKNWSRFEIGEGFLKSKINRF
jgi:hypothetical protein